mmetsp:Transcript_14246/g.36057  ORF Transcript_14246/g.36057 Transcript_14246/m.36057 type:complete len:224 (-) Transcript_14246:527-1198(-)
MPCSCLSCERYLCWILARDRQSASAFVSRSASVETLAAALPGVPSAVRFCALLAGGSLSPRGGSLSCDLSRKDLVKSLFTSMIDVPTWATFSALVSRLVSCTLSASAIPTHTNEVRSSSVIRLRSFSTLAFKPRSLAASCSVAGATGSEVGFLKNIAAMLMYWESLTRQPSRRLIPSSSTPGSCRSLSVCPVGAVSSTMWSYLASDSFSRMCTSAMASSMPGR